MHKVLVCSGQTETAHCFVIYDFSLNSITCFSNCKEPATTGNTTPHLVVVSHTHTKLCLYLSVIKP